jgi:hypothetical protein
MSYTYFIDADHQINTQKFQLPLGYEEKFINLAKIVYGYPCMLTNKVTDQNQEYFLGFIIQKPNGVKVYYKSMSAGEKK